MSQVEEQIPPQPAAQDNDDNNNTREISLWAHENPHLKQSTIENREMHETKEDDAVFQFTFPEIPKKIREAEQYYDQCEYDISTSILVKCIQLYDEQYGEGWCANALEQDRPLIEMANCNEILEFARLLKEYALNLVYLAKYQDSLNVEVDEETGKPLGLVAEADEDADAAKDDAIAGVMSDDKKDDNDKEEDEEEADAPLGGDAFDDDSEDEEDLDEDAENEETYQRLATENLQMAFQIFGRYIIERSCSDDALEVHQTKDADGKEVNLQYALGPTSTLNIPATDLLPFLWRKEDGVTIKRTEICQVYLGDVYDALSDVHCEEEQWEDAARYLQLSLKLRKKTEKSYGRGLASIHTKYATYYGLRNQYELSNKHWLLAACVFAYRAIDKVDWLYRNFEKTNLAEKCPNTLEIKVQTSTEDDKMLLTREQINSIYQFANDKLIPAIKMDIYGGNGILDKNTDAAINNILDYFNIIENIFDLYEDNLQDIAEGKGADGKSIDQEVAGEKEAQRVKNMVQEVMRTDQLKESIKGKDVNEALGFKKINKTGDIATTLQNIGTATTTTNGATTVVAAITPTDAPAHVPAVKRKIRPVVADDDSISDAAVKKQRTE